MVTFLRFTAIDNFVLSSNPTSKNIFHLQAPFTTLTCWPVDYVPMVVYSGIEIDVAVMVACAPAIPALLKAIRERAAAKSSHSQSRTTLDPGSAEAQLRSVVVTTSIEQKTNFPSTLPGESVLSDRYIPLHDMEARPQYIQYASHVHSEAWGGR